MGREGDTCWDFRFVGVECTALAGVLCLVYCIYVKFYPTSSVLLKDINRAVDLFMLKWKVKNSFLKGVFLSFLPSIF